MSTSAIWLLIADAERALLFESDNGSSRFLMSLGRRPGDDCDAFAYDIMRVLHAAAEDAECEGMVFVADAPMISALRRLKSYAVSRLVIAEIVESEPTAGHRAEKIPTVAANENTNAPGNAAVTKARKRNPFAMPSRPRPALYSISGGSGRGS